MTQPTVTSSPPQPDAALLQAFAADGNERAFTQLVGAHSGMVLAVCRSVLGNTADAQDAAQAVFLTLAQKSSSAHVQRHLVGWLHRVAWYVAARAAAARAIRRRHEQEAARMKNEISSPQEEFISPELLHAGLAALPEKYRVPLLLHHVEGRTQEETAALLGCGASAVAMRLNRGRKMLRERLAKSGVACTATGLAVFLEAQTAASASPVFIALATKSAAAVAAHQLASASIVSGTTLALSKGALVMLTWEKIKLVAALVTIFVLTGGSIGTYVALAHGTARVALDTTTAPADQKETITGVAAALTDPNSKPMNPAIANATVTVTTNGVDTVYQVFGWAGIICRNNDGKTVQVTGLVHQTSIGTLTITARSIDVKVIIVQ